ncbi:MAG: hypothetical protein IKJ11_04895 [Clostridia bacterium]|nr:hypothetical protein [Clostridia bacterium]
MATKVPAYSYDGTSSSEVRNGYWYIYLKTTGTKAFTMAYAKTGVEVCIVGGGAGGRAYSTIHDQGEDGGGGGTVLNKTGVSIAAGTVYPITVGAGGSLSTWSSTGGWHGEGGEGGASSAFGFTAAGGQTGKGNAGLSKTDADATAGGAGTYAFGDTSLPRYGGGGGGGADDWYKPGAGGAGGGGRGGYGKAAGKTDSASANAIAGAANTGGGGGGAGEGYAEGYDNAVSGNAAKGGSGIVIIRGTEDDFLPVYFNGTQLSEIYFNGEKLAGLIYGGTRIFARVMAWIRGRIGLDTGEVVPA